MWALRVLSGSQAGAVHPLKLGRNLIGRSPQCDVAITSSGVSKEHAEIHVYKDKILVVDLRSSNGTYLNGIKVQNGLVRLGDKMSIHDVLIDVIPAPDSRPRVATANAGMTPMPSQHQMHARPPMVQGGQHPPMSYGAAAPAYYPPPQHHQHQHQQAPQAAAPATQNMMATHGLFKGLFMNFEDYMERVALPGIYKLPQLLEFKLVLGTFVLMFIFSVTLLSMLPMIQITRSSIVQESKRRANSLARNLAQANQQALLAGNLSALSTHAIDTEDGVKRAIIVNQSDGMILAPVSQSSSSSDIGFVVTARRDSKPQTVEVDLTTIGASFPIGMYDPNTGEPVVKAHAVVMYDIGSLAFDDGRALSLFFQTLVIASLIGLIVFYFMYKLIEYPLVNLNQQLDQAMREKKDNLQLKFEFPALQALIGNLNSLLTRYIHGDTEGGGGAVFGNKDSEAANLVHLVGFPAMTIRADSTIISCNSGFEQLARSTSDIMANQTIDAVQDASLRQNLEHLLAKAREVPQSVHSDQLEFSGHLCTVNCQAFSTSETVDYFLVSVAPVEGGDG